MPSVHCPECGSTTYIDAYALPYKGEVGCTECGIHLFVEGDMSIGFTVTRMRFSLRELEKYWGYLDQLEKTRLEEAVFCSNYAPTACESMCFDALCGLLRRIYGGKRELGFYVGKMEKDPDLRELSGAISYFKARRNEVDHPDRIANPLEAESTFSMTKRLIIGIIEKKPLLSLIPE